MTKSRYPWWGFAKSMIYRYPALNVEAERLQAANVTPNYDAVGHGSGISKPTEQAALRQLPAPDQRQLDAVRQAVNLTRQLPNGERRLAMIDIVYWRKVGNLQYAADKLYYSYRTLCWWHSDFVHLVARYYGLEE